MNGKKKSVLKNLQQFKYSKDSNSKFKHNISDSDSEMVVEETPPSDDDMTISSKKPKRRHIISESEPESQVELSSNHTQSTQDTECSSVVANGKSRKFHVISDSESDDESPKARMNGTSKKRLLSESDSDASHSTSNKHSKSNGISESDESNSEPWLCAKKPAAKRRRKSSSDEDYNPSEGSSNESELKSTAESAPDKFTKEKVFNYVRNKFPQEDVMEIYNVLKQVNYKINEAIGKLSSKRDEKLVQTAKKLMKGRSSKKKESDSEISGGESDDNDVVDDDDEAVYNSEEDDFDGTLTPKRQKVIDFLQNATNEELQHIPSCGSKKVNAIIAARPFTDWLQLVKCLKNGKFLDTDILEGVTSVIDMRDALRRLLEKCEMLSSKLNSAAGNLLDDTSGQQLKAQNKLIAQPELLDSSLSLKPHQLLAVEWMHLLHTYDVNCILADEMGLGKTIETIAFLAYLAQNGIEGPHTVIVPSSTIENWIREFEKWCPSMQVLAYVGTQRERLILRHNICKAKTEKFDILITTYNLVTRNPKDLLLFKKYKFNYAVFDEAHLMKNAATQCYRSLMLINAKRRLLLTGTPLQNNLMELLSILMFAMPKLFKGNRTKIEKMFSMASKGSPEADYYKSRIEQAKKIMKPFVLRRLKEDVIQDLPQKECTIVECGMTEKQRDMYDNLINEIKHKPDEVGPKGLSLMMQLRKISNHPLLMRSLYDDDAIQQLAGYLAEDILYKETNKDYILEDLSYMSDYDIHQICIKHASCKSRCLSTDQLVSSGKLQMLDDMLPNFKAQGNKVLIFSQFTMVLDIIEEYMNIRDYNYLRLDGSTPVLKRQDLMDEFNTDENMFVFLLSTRSGGLGINLTSANNVILHDIDFNPFNDRQAEDRCHRVGQTKDVKVYRLISKDSIEENMLERAKGKLMLEKQITDGSIDNLNEVPSDIAEMLTSVVFKV